jgi:hypothetical protein
MKHVLLALVLVVSTSAYSDTLYRCGNEYSQTPCSGDAKKVRLSSANGADETATEGGNSVCERDLVKWVKFMDPYSIKIESVAKPKGEIIDFADTRMSVWNHVVYVNAKNSYGAYSGTKAYNCYTSMDKQRILKVVPPHD